jgi:hypothetical protein
MVSRLAISVVVIGGQQFRSARQHIGKRFVELTPKHHVRKTTCLARNFTPRPGTDIIPFLRKAFADIIHKYHAR